MTDLGLTSRAPADNTADDTILPFEVAPLDLRGRVVRLGLPSTISSAVISIRRPSKTVG